MKAQRRFWKYFPESVSVLSFWYIKTVGSKNVAQYVIRNIEEPIKPSIKSQYPKKYVNVKSRGPIVIRKDKKIPKFLFHEYLGIWSSWSWNCTYVRCLNIAEAPLKRLTKLNMIDATLIGLSPNHNALNCNWGSVLIHVVTFHIPYYRINFLQLFKK